MHTAPKPIRRAHFGSGFKACSAHLAHQTGASEADVTSEFVCAMILEELSRLRIEHINNKETEAGGELWNICRGHRQYAKT